MGSKFTGEAREVQALDAFIKLKRASESLSAVLSLDFAQWKITESQFGVLEALYHLGPLCQKAIGTKILKSTGNITLVVDNLEKRKLVTRVREEGDRRFIQVHLTQEGRDLISSVFPSHAAKIATLFQALTPKEQETLGELCKKLGKEVTKFPLELVR